MTACSSWRWSGGVAVVAILGFVAVDLWRAHQGLPLGEGYHDAPGLSDAGDLSLGTAVEIDGVTNVRDIGGVPCAGGRVVRKGMVYRAGRLSDMTALGQRQLDDLGVRLVADFRSSAEVARHPDNLDVDVAPKMRWQQFDASDGNVDDEIRAILRSSDTDTTLGRGEEGEGGGGGGGRRGRMVRHILGMYEHFATTHRAVFATFLTALAEGDVPVLLHCTAGKDRTGWAVALLGKILGVAEETIVKDYLVSNAQWDGTARNFAVLIRLYTAWHLVPAGPEVNEPQLKVRRTYLDAGFRKVREEYGSWEQYFAEGLGLSQDTLAQLRERLSTDGAKGN